MAWKSAFCKAFATGFGPQETLFEESIPLFRDGVREEPPNKELARDGVPHTIPDESVTGLM